MGEGGDVSSIINMAASLMGHMPGRSRDVQKNVADDVMIKLLEMMSRNKYSEGELKGLLSDLTVDKVHKPSRRRIRTGYGRGGQDGAKHRMGGFKGSRLQGGSRRLLPLPAR